MTNIKLPTVPFSSDPAEVISSLDSDYTSGLSFQEVKKRQKVFGENQINGEEKKSGWTILINQFKSPIIWLLIAAAGVAFYLGDILDGIAITIVIMINTSIGFYMEFGAQRSMESLKKLTSVKSKVVRNGKMQEIPSQEIVPGDIVYIEAGDLIPADGRVLSVSQLQTDESALTGESVPVEKTTRKIETDAVLADRINMLYKGTYSTKGNGYMIVTATGIKTELGKIAGLVKTSKKKATPLEKKLEALTRTLIRVTIVIVILILLSELINGKPLLDILETGIALAVSAIPEGLPIVATISLANGMKKMAQHNVIVKRLSSIETLGGTNVICTDKTGTLTENKIEVKKIVTPADNDENLRIINHIAILCNTAEIEKVDGDIIEIGDPLETGLLKFASSNGYDIADLRSVNPKVNEVPFSSETRLMATMHKVNGDYIIYAKGATEEIIRRCEFIYDKDKIVPATSEKKQYWLNRSDELAGDGLRVIAGAYKMSLEKEESPTEKLIFAGLFGMIDPPRKEVAEAIRECKSAGINIIMITGDHPATAKNIALQLGITDNTSENTLSGKDLRDLKLLSEEEKQQWINTKTFARVSPEQKLDLITVLQEKNNVVGMTGDGVNDAPALKKADIGIAMGIRGTQVSQEAADMVLKDDSFSSIVLAIKQGRITFKNIRMFVVYLLSSNLSEIFIITSISLLDLPFRLFPLQILFLNLLTDVFPALALGVIEGDDLIMKQPPRKLNEPIITRSLWRSIFIYSLIIGITSIGAVIFSHYTVHATESQWNPELCNNILFYTIIFSQLLHVFNMKSSGTSYFKSEIFKSKTVWLALFISTSLVLFMSAFEITRKSLEIYPLSIYDWLIIGGACITGMLLIQAFKKLKIISDK